MLTVVLLYFDVSCRRGRSPGDVLIGGLPPRSVMKPKSFLFDAGTVRGNVRFVSNGSQTAELLTST